MGEHAGSTLPYVPGIDGLRAVAVLAVLAFHLEIGGFDGGFLGVSLFFTLSGFLITQLLVGEHTTSGRIALGRFWGRRFRRLMPAALTALVLVAVVSLTTDVFDGRRLRGDLLAGVGYVANWRFASGSQSYTDLFTTTPSPIQHFWSLAIEEQFYVLFPLLVAAAFWLARRIRVGDSRRLAGPIGVVAVLLVASVVAGLVTDAEDLVYYGTHTRAAELLVGALLAFALPIGREVSRTTARTLAGLSLVGLVVFGLMVAMVSTSDGWLYDGGLAGFSVVSATLVIGSLVPGPLQRVLSWSPLVRIGRISYGVYVFHWPVIVALDEDRVGTSGWSLVVVRAAVTFALAVASAYLLENPIRRRRVLVRPRIAAAFGVSGLLVAGALSLSVRVPAPVMAAGLDAPDEVVSFGVDTSSDGTSADGTSGSPSPISSEGPTTNALRIVVIGSVEGAAAAITAARPDSVAAEIVDLTQPGCPIRPAGDVLNGCRPYDDVVTDVFDGGPPDLVVLAVGGPERILLRGLIGELRPGAMLERPEIAQRPFRVIDDYADDLVTPLASVPLLIWDQSVADGLRGDLTDIDARSEDVSMVVRPTADELADRLKAAIERLEGLDDRTRVVVIGDSTSYGVAAAIDAVAGDRYDVLWAGGRNCPLVRALEVRWWPDMAFDVSKCPTLEGTWTKIFDDFQPQLLIVVVSVPEQSEQRYTETTPDTSDMANDAANDETNDEWFAVGDPEFDDRHREVVDSLIGLANAHSTRVVFFDAPPIISGSFAESDFADRRRVRGWNRLISEFAEKWPEIVVFDWSDVVARAETANGGKAGSLRGDGVHMANDVLTLLAGTEIAPFIDQLLATGVVTTTGD